MRSSVMPHGRFLNNAQQWEKGQQWERALALVREVARRRVAPDVVSYNAQGCKAIQQLMFAFKGLCSNQ